MEIDINEKFDTDDELTKQAVNFAHFMQNRGYGIYPDFFERFFAVMAATGLKFEEAEPAIKSLVVRDKDSEASFMFDFADFINNSHKRSAAKTAKKHAEKMEELNESESEIAQAERKINWAEKRIESLEERDSSKCIDDKDIKYMSGKRKKFGDEIDKINEKCGLKDLEDELSNGDYEPQKVKEKLRKAIAESVYSESFKDLMNYYKRAYKIADNFEKSRDEFVREQLSKHQANLERLQKEAETLKQQRDKIKAELSSVNERMLKKLEAASHRDQFQAGGSVQAQNFYDLDETELNTDFTFLSAKQKEEIKRYIRENARIFRTRMSRNIHANTKPRIDLPETCKKACGTNGVPMRLCFEKPVRSKTKLLMFLDISGSCREASELMLYFMFCMKDLFPAGCKCYVFVNHLFDISEFFDTSDPDEAVKAVMSNIQTRGVYSDYGVPFSEFYNEHQAEVTKDSIVFFIGDARNNRRESGERFVKYIGRKCKNAYWFNTEIRNDWDCGDSIISTYQPYMDRVDQVTTANELIESLMRGK